MRCSRYAVYAYPGTVDRVLCKEHATPDMIRPRKTMCEVFECDTRANYGWPGTTDTIRCKAHALEHMIDLRSPRCQVGGCVAIAHFADASDPERRVACRRHMTKNMVPASSYICKHPGCCKYKGYGWPRGPRVYCGEHAVPGMVHMGDRRCEEPGCTNRIDRIAGAPVQYFCPEHDRGEILPTHANRCHAFKCNKNAVCNPTASGQATRCAVHVIKEDNTFYPSPWMERLGDRPVLAEPADPPSQWIRWSPDEPDEPPPRKEPRARKTPQKKRRVPECWAAGCKAPPTYAPPGAKIPVCCKAHAREEMVLSARKK